MSTDDQCSHVTLKGARCKRKARAGKNCAIHSRPQCPVCFEVIQKSDLKELTCKHTFHADCIMQWYVEANTCPVCRVPQKGDKLIHFKNLVENSMREKYKNAIQSLEQEIHYLRQGRRTNPMIIDDSD